MWASVVQEIDGKPCVYEAAGARTAARVFGAAIGRAFLKIDLHVSETDERVTVVGYLPQLCLSVDDVDGVVTVRQLSGEWALQFDHNMIGGGP